MALNPTGANAAPQAIVQPYQAGGAPTTGSPGTYNFGNTGNPAPPMPPQGTNPYGPTPGTGTAATSNSGFSTPTGPQPIAINPAGPISPAGTVNPNKIAPTVTSGLAGPIATFLNSGGGYNSQLTDQNVQAQIEAMQHDVQLGEGNLQTNLSEAGISPNSSVSALETSNYMADATTKENALVAQDYYNMWSQSQQQETSMLESLIAPSAQHQQNTSFMGVMDQTFADIGQIFGGSASYSGGSGGHG